MDEWCPRGTCRIYMWHDSSTHLRCYCRALVYDCRALVYHLPASYLRGQIRGWHVVAVEVGRVAVCVCKGESKTVYERERRVGDTVECCRCIRQSVADVRGRGTDHNYLVCINTSKKAIVTPPCHHSSSSCGYTEVTDDWTRLTSCSDDVSCLKTLSNTVLLVIRWCSLLTPHLTSSFDINWSDILDALPLLNISLFCFALSWHRLLC